MRKGLLAILTATSLALPAHAADPITKEFHGIPWGAPFQTVINKLGTRYRFTEKDDGNWHYFNGSFAGYNVDFTAFPDKKFAFLAIRINSQKGRTSAQIWHDLYGKLKTKYGPTYACGWRQSPDNEWVDFPQDEEDRQVIWNSFNSAKNDVKYDWYVDRTIQVTLQSLITREDRRTVLLYYKHVPLNRQQIANEEKSAISDL